MNLEETALSFLDARQDKLVAMARGIWECPELGLQEAFSSKLLAEALQQAGFDVDRGVGEMPTAFVASWGKRKPIIGILGEYDALPNLSQDVVPAKQSIHEGAPGHGCGHNLLGVASLGAALAAQEAMKQAGIEGMIRYYGCPAEETLIGKVFMARNGVFDNLDAAITWHPGYVNSVWATISMALNSFKVSFYGAASHAGSTPELGRSALDAALLMDVGVNYMREHLPRESRIHGVILAGGEAPNIVPPYAQVWYYIRAPDRKLADDIYSWVLDIAKGAALMTGTTYEIEFLTGCHNTLPNEVIGDLLQKKLRLLGAPRYNETEKAMARRLQETFPAGSIEESLKRHRMTREEIGDPLCETIVEPRNKGEITGGSTDVGDVSYITPTAQITTCCQALGTPGHSWQNVVTSGSTIGFKGMMLAARVLALTALGLVTTPHLLAAAREEFERETGGKEYVSPLPESAHPQPVG